MAPYVCKLSPSKSFLLSLSLDNSLINLAQHEIEYFNNQSDFKCSASNSSLNFYITIINTCFYMLEKNYCEYVNIHRLNPKISKLKIAVKSLKSEGFYEVFANNLHEISAPEVLSCLSKILLKSVKEVLISKDLFSKIKKSYGKTISRNNIYFIHKILFGLPLMTKILLTRLFKHFEIISNNSGKNNMDILSLCTVFLPSIIFDSPSKKTNEVIYFKEQIATLYFIAKYNYLLNTPIEEEEKSLNGGLNFFKNIDIKFYFTSFWKKLTSTNSNKTNKKKKPGEKSDPARGPTGKDPN